MSYHWRVLPVWMKKYLLFKWSMQHIFFQFFSFSIKMRHFLYFGSFTLIFYCQGFFSLFPTIKFQHQQHRYMVIPTDCWDITYRTKLTLLASMDLKHFQPYIVFKLHLVHGRLHKLNPLHDSTWPCLPMGPGFTNFVFNNFWGRIKCLILKKKMLCFFLFVNI